MPWDLSRIVYSILDQYALPWDGDHGVARWARVLENGLRLAGITGTDVEVVTLFAVFHDSKRVSELTDPQHGQRGADSACELRGQVFELSDRQFTLLYRACAGHTYERTFPDITVQTCWDADRLDLGRVGIQPCANRLCTEAAKDPKIMRSSSSPKSVSRLCPRFMT